MDINNLDRAIETNRELERLNTAISVLEHWSNLAPSPSLFFNQNSDGSGYKISPQYLRGQHHPMYEEIVEFTLFKFREARETLLNEIASL